jgi:hypothetical protein
MGGGWGIYSPNHQKWPLGGCLSHGAPTVRCATGHCPVRQPRHLAVGFWPLELLTSGPPDSPVVHRTVTVHCPVRLLALLWTLARCARTVAHLMRIANDRWREVAVAPLAHRTVRWIIAERLPEFPKVASLELSSLVHRTLSGGAPDTVRWHTGQSGAPDQGTLRLSFALLIWTLSWSFHLFVVSLWHL